jgi:enamine deaminase RidA (YjgF/YER057c/UK114 family)
MSCKVVCKETQVVRENPTGTIVPEPTPPTAYGLATIDVTGKVLYVGGLQGFRPDETQPPTIEERIQLAYDQMYAVARYYGAEPTDVLRLVLYANPNAPVAVAQYPNLSFEERFIIIRNTANAIQAPIYGNNAPARTLVGVTYIVLDDVFEIEGTFKLPGKQPVCKKVKKCKC